LWTSLSTLHPGWHDEPHRQHLIIDADDTLWENNIYFERAFEEFVQFLDHSTAERRRGPHRFWMRLSSPMPESTAYGSANFAGI